MKTLLIIFLFICTVSAFAKNNPTIKNETDSTMSKEFEVANKYRVVIPNLVIEGLIDESWNERSSTQHLELHVKRNLDNKNIIGLKFATFRLFQPMGITWWDGILGKMESKSEYYPGHAQATGIGITYQRMLWKGLFSTAEILPQYLTYLDLDGHEITNSFRLYTSYHLGYHFAFGKGEHFFIEPQINSMLWTSDNNAPDGFKQLDEKWRNYFLFEPQIYIGVSF